MTKTLIATAVLLGASTASMAWTITPTTVYFTNANGQQLSGHLFKPATATPVGGRPAVVMLHGCSGVFYVNPQGVASISSIYREWADRLAAAGYVALLVDSLSQRGLGSQCGNGPGVGLSEIFDRPADAVAGRNYLVGAGLSVKADRIGLLGWSNGGSTVLATLATKKPVTYTVDSPLAVGAPFRVGVAFYPGAGLSDPKCYQVRPNGTTTTSCWNGLDQTVWDSYAPLAIHQGTADTTTLPAYVNQRVGPAWASAGGAQISVSLYGAAVHSFDDPNTGGGVCDATKPNACAKATADAATMASFAKWLN